MNTNTKRSVFCPSCRSHHCVHWGVSDSGTLRYRCSSCGKTFRSVQKRTGYQRSFLWYFEQYVLYGVTYAVVSRWSGYSLRQLHRQFQVLLAQEPPILVIPQDIPLVGDGETYLILDGRWFGKRICLMVYRQSRSKLILHISFMKREYGSLIFKNLKELHQKGYRFTGVVSDGGTGIRHAVIRMYGPVPHQVCMAHIHRQATNGLGKQPKEERVQELKKLADHMWKIESKEAREWWKQQVHQWTRTHGLFLGETRWDSTGHWWYIHTGVRKCVSALNTAYVDCFTFLDHPLMPKTTNEIEATIGNLSMKQLLHRGMKQENLEPFIRWFIYFYNRNLLSQRKTKEA